MSESYGISESHSISSHTYSSSDFFNFVYEIINHEHGDSVRNLVHRVETSINLNYMLDRRIGVFIEKFPRDRYFLMRIKIIYERMNKVN